MADNEKEVKIRFTLDGEAEFSRSLSDISAAHKKQEEALKGYSDLLKNMAVQFGAISAAGTLLMGKMISEAAEAEQADVKLARALENLGMKSEENTQKIEAAAKAMQDQTGIADDMLLPAYTRLIRETGNINTAIEIMPRVLDVASARMTDAGTVTQALQMAFLGNTRQLEQMGIEIEKGADKTEILNAFMEQTGKYVGYASDNMGTWAGVMAGIRNNLDDLYKIGGKVIIETLQPMARWVFEATKNFAEFAANNPVVVQAFVALTAAITGGAGLIAGLAGLRLLMMTFSAATIPALLTAIRMLTVGLLTNPFTVWIAALGTVITLVYQFRDALASIGKYIGWISNPAQASFDLAKATSDYLFGAKEKAGATPGPHEAAAEYAAEKYPDVSGTGESYEAQMLRAQEYDRLRSEGSSMNLMTGEMTGGKTAQQISAGDAEDKPFGTWGGTSGYDVGNRSGEATAGRELYGYGVGFSNSGINTEGIGASGAGLSENQEWANYSTADFYKAQQLSGNVTGGDVSRLGGPGSAGVYINVNAGLVTDTKAIAEGVQQALNKTDLAPKLGDSVVM
jgi:hypothetical protein